MSQPDAKPLGQKAYGSIAHLPGSRKGPGDHSCHEGQARIACVKPRDRHDRILVQEKLDGSCVSVAKINGELVPLGRAGYRAITSPFPMHHLFDAWVRDPGRYAAFDGLLQEGERAVGEWLAQAHGTRYDLTHYAPFVLFDIMTGITRTPAEKLQERAWEWGFTTPTIIAIGPTSIEDAMQALGAHGFHGALDPVEGAVWRVERQGVVDYLVKYVRPDKVDGAYLPGANGNAPDAEPVWNWQP